MAKNRIGELRDSKK
jgi:hypothetical protein